MKQRKGFTLIELLVVISIISLLSAIVMVALNSARAKAQYSKAESELRNFIKVAVIAQGESGKRLQDITGNGCSSCICATGTDLRNIPTTDSCYIRWVNAITTIQNGTKGAVQGFTQMTRDPWGSPYLLDENEREAGPTYCVQDTIRSAGPDGLKATSDDRFYYVPFSRNCP